MVLPDKNAQIRELFHLLERSMVDLEKLGENANTVKCGGCGRELKCTTCHFDPSLHAQYVAGFEAGKTGINAQEYGRGVLDGREGLRKEILELLEKHFGKTA